MMFAPPNVNISDVVFIVNAISAVDAVSTIAPFREYAVTESTAIPRITCCSKILDSTSVLSSNVLIVSSAGNSKYNLNKKYNYYPTDETNDNIEQIRTNSKYADLNKFNLIGHSMGGMIVQEITKIVGDRVNKLICYAT